MRALLTAIQDRLRQRLSYVRPADIYIAPHVDYIPAAARTPCVGLKDGPVARRELAGGWWEVVSRVHLAVYVELAKSEAAVMGDAASDKKGVLQIVEDIHESLDEHLPDIDGMQAAFCPEEAESVPVTTDRADLQRKIVTYQYTLEEERP